MMKERVRVSLIQEDKMTMVDNDKLFSHSPSEAVGDGDGERDGASVGGVGANEQSVAEKRGGGV